MKERLEQLTMAQFIGLVSGDTGVLTDAREKVPELKMVTAVRDIVYEYKEIADPAGARGYLQSMGELVKARVWLLLLTVCRELMELRAYDRVRSVLGECGVPAASMDERRLAAEVSSRVARARKTVTEIEDERRAGTRAGADIRREFDAQTAALMAHFRFQIDTSTMKAPVYAHLVARYNREIRARMQALKKK